MSPFINRIVSWVLMGSLVGHLMDSNISSLTTTPHSTTNYCFESFPPNSKIRGSSEKNLSSSIIVAKRREKSVRIKRILLGPKNTWSNFPLSPHLSPSLIQPMPWNNGRVTGALGVTHSMRETMDLGWKWKVEKMNDFTFEQNRRRTIKASWIPDIRQFSLFRFPILIRKGLCRKKTKIKEREEFRDGIIILFVES